VLSSLVNYLSHPGPRDKFNEFASSFVDCAIERAEEGVVTVGESRPIQQDCTKFQRDSPSRLFVSEINGIRAGFIRLALARVTELSHARACNFYDITDSIILPMLLPLRPLPLIRRRCFVISEDVSFDAL